MSIVLAKNFRIKLKIYPQQIFCKLISNCTSQFVLQLHEVVP